MWFVSFATKISKKKFFFNIMFVYFIVYSKLLLHVLPSRGSKSSIPQQSQFPAELTSKWLGVAWNNAGDVLRMVACLWKLSQVVMSFNG